MLYNYVVFVSFVFADILEKEVISNWRN